jgi:hypothetical protein
MPIGLFLALGVSFPGLTPIAQERVPWANKFFVEKAPPAVIVKDFGVIKKGTMKTYRIDITNVYAIPFEIREPRPTRGYVSVKDYPGSLRPRETGQIIVELDASKFVGKASVKMPVQVRAFDPKTNEQYWSIADLELRVESK